MTAYCGACDHALTSPAHHERCVDTAAQKLADVLDLLALAERANPSHRYVSTKRLREVIEGAAS